jgi:long-subunit acyl-CoA synthetase (AMP-forming)
VQVERGQSSLSLLPPWHIYERTVTYYLLASGGLVTYSSIKNFKADLKTVKPNFLVCVPLVLDTLHSRIMSTIQQAQGLQRSLVTWLLDCAMIHTRVCVVGFIPLAFVTVVVKLLESCNQLTLLLPRIRPRMSEGKRGADLAEHLS